MKTSTTDHAPPRNPCGGAAHSLAPEEAEELRTSQFLLKPSRILVPVDFSEASVWSLRHTARLAERHGSSVFLLHVVDSGAFINDLRNLPLVKPEEQSLRDAENGLRRLADSELPAVKVAFLLAKSGRLGPEIIRAAREANSDLIVLTVDHRSAVERARHFLFGSTAAWVERHALCPVLTLSLPKGAPGWLHHERGREDRNGVSPQLARAVWNESPTEKANMKIQYLLRGLPPRVVTDRPLDPHLERLDRLIAIDSAQVMLEHQPNAAPAFCASVDLAVPGPDIHAAARDHTLEAAVLKVARRLEDQIESRKNRQQLRLKRRENSRAVASQWGRGA
jgi:nucleotide-binding universal stress UspA family protein/ribosome-associated translation inhibitor RaiA